jgi:predicted 3-demethylubiquinone-9 3-methyltransferase (glyoxalase superfamily)
MQKITPFLWFDTQAEEAVGFYLSVFKDGKIHATTRYPEDGPGAARISSCRQEMRLQCVGRASYDPTLPRPTKLYV